MQCTELQWIEENNAFYQWYYDEYPELIENDVTLPITFERLKLFYVLDMEERNLTPQEEMLKCYEHLFSYFLGRLDGTIYVQGRSWIELTIQNFPNAVSETFESIAEGITNPFGIPLFVWLILIIVLIVLIKR